jgi:hypothetical protein
MLRRVTVELDGRRPRPEKCYVERLFRFLARPFAE